jgi:hypothetical protein
MTPSAPADKSPPLELAVIAARRWWIRSSPPPLPDPPLPRETQTWSGYSSRRTIRRVEIIWISAAEVDRWLGLDRHEPEPASPSQPERPDEETLRKFRAWLLTFGPRPVPKTGPRPLAPSVEPALLSEAIHERLSLLATDLERGRVDGEASVRMASAQEGAGRD